MNQSTAIITILFWGTPLIRLAATPVPTYGTYFAGVGGDTYATAVGRTATGEIVIAGSTTAQTMPGTAHAFQQTRANGFPNNTDAFVAKFDATGHKLLWATFLGGDGNDIATKLDIDQVGNVLVIGTTNSSNFPTKPFINCKSGTVSLQQQQCSTASSGMPSSFVAKVSADGSSLLYSTGFVGLNATGLAVDKKGNADVAAGGFSGLYLIQLDSTGKILFSSLLGGGGFNASETSAAAVVVDQVGNIWIGGTIATQGVALPTTANAFQRQQSNEGLVNSIGPGALSNGFIVGIDPSGSRAIYGTYFGPRYAGTSLNGMAIGTDGSVYFGGWTNATTLQATAGAYVANPSRGLVGKLRPGSTVLDGLSFSSGWPQKLSVNQSAGAVQVLLGNTDTGYSQFIQLSALNLALMSPTPSLSDFGVTDFVSSSQSVSWLVGSCNRNTVPGTCSTNSSRFISSDAYQSQAGSVGDAMLVQFTDVSPAVSQAVSASTFAAPVSAGQLISVFGTQLGPLVGAGPVLTADGTISTSSGGTRVLFDGVAAPILYAQANQVNAAIPCALTSRSTTQLVVEYAGVPSAPLTIQLSDASPGIFTLSGLGTGMGAILNQDYSINGPLNPAARGSVVMVFATGLGPTSPPCIDGNVYQGQLPIMTLPVGAQIGDSIASVLYSGQAPGDVAGVDQVNVVLPDNAPTGDAVPISIIVGNRSSRPGVTIAVK